VDGAKLFASLFTTIFLVLGLFSIASGVLLIFMIFVMLAAERRQEMGITRAVGAERKHLVQAFLAEGMVYDLFAGLIGVVLGLFFALVVVVGGVKLIFGEGLAFIEPHVAPRSLVVSFCLGAVLTFITVVASTSSRRSGGKLNLAHGSRTGGAPYAGLPSAHRSSWCCRRSGCTGCSAADSASR
jgi:putative ABC transport system permease protein